MAPCYYSVIFLESLRHGQLPVDLQSLSVSLFKTDTFIRRRGTKYWPCYFSVVFLESMRHRHLTAESGVPSVGSCCSSVIFYMNLLKRTPTVYPFPLSTHFLSLTLGVDPCRYIVVSFGAKNNLY